VLVNGQLLIDSNTKMEALTPASTSGQ